MTAAYRTLIKHRIDQAARARQQVGRNHRRIGNTPHRLEPEHTGTWPPTTTIGDVFAAITDRRLSQDWS